MTNVTRRYIARMIYRHPVIGSLLYDLDLMPEQVKPDDKRREHYMAAVVQHNAEAKRG